LASDVASVDVGRSIPEIPEEEKFLGSAPGLEDEEGGDDGEDGEVSFWRERVGHGVCWVCVAVQWTLVL